MTGGPPGRVAYLCADPGIPPDGSKGASVHFRAMASALLRNGVELDVFMTREGDASDYRKTSGTTHPLLGMRMWAFAFTRTRAREAIAARLRRVPDLAV